MSEREPNHSTLSDYHPLASDPFKVTKDIYTIQSKNGNILVRGRSSYDIALETAHEAVEVIPCDVRRDLAERALLATIANQAWRNNEGNITDEMRDNYPDVIAGDAEPAEMVAMLHEYPGSGALELARTTHVGRWNVQNIIDLPVRRSLDTVPGTKREASAPRYKIKMFDEDGAAVERKRVVRSHYNGQLLTVLRNTMLVDYHSPEMPDELLDYMTNEHKMLLKKKTYDYNSETRTLHGFLEKYVSYRSGTQTNQEQIDEPNKPDWVIPLLSTYYSADASLIGPDKQQNKEQTD